MVSPSHNRWRPVVRQERWRRVVKRQRQLLSGGSSGQKEATATFSTPKPKVRLAPALRPSSPPSPPTRHALQPDEWPFGLPVLLHAQFWRPTVVCALPAQGPARCCACSMSSPPRSPVCTAESRWTDPRWTACYTDGGHLYYFNSETKGSVLGHPKNKTSLSFFKMAATNLRCVLRAC